MIMTAVAETITPAPIPGERTLLIVEDDKSFLQRLARAMESRGFTVTTAESVADGLIHVETSFSGLDGSGSTQMSAAERYPRRSLSLTKPVSSTQPSSASSVASSRRLVSESPLPMITQWKSSRCRS